MNATTGSIWRATTQTRIVMLLRIAQAALLRKGGAGGVHSISVAQYRLLRAEGRAVVVQPLYMLVSQRAYGVPVMLVGFLEGKPEHPMVVVEWPRELRDRGRSLARDIPEVTGGLD